MVGQLIPFAAALARLGPAAKMLERTRKIAGPFQQLIDLMANREPPGPDNPAKVIPFDPNFEGYTPPGERQERMVRDFLTGQDRPMTDEEKFGRALEAQRTTKNPSAKINQEAMRRTRAQFKEGEFDSKAFQDAFHKNKADVMREQSGDNPNTFKDDSDFGKRLKDSLDTHVSGKPPQPPTAPPAPPGDMAPGDIEFSQTIQQMFGSDPEATDSLVMGLKRAIQSGRKFSDEEITSLARNLPKAQDGRPGDPRYTVTDDMLLDKRKETQAELNKSAARERALIRQEAMRRAVAEVGESADDGVLERVFREKVREVSIERGGPSGEFKQEPLEPTDTFSPPRGPQPKISELLETKGQDAVNELLTGMFHDLKRSGGLTDDQAQDFLQRLVHREEQLGRALTRREFFDLGREVLGSEPPNKGLFEGAGPLKFADDLPPPEAVEKFTELANLQRGEPEAAMTRVQNAMGGGVLNGVVEHVGDLTHRMTEMAQYGHDGYEFFRDKVEKTQRWLNDPYGFEKEMEENIRANARYKGVSEDEVRTHVDATLEAYARAHEKLPVYNDMQRKARDAAVALGRKQFDEARRLLKELDEMSVTPEEYRKHVWKFEGEKPEGVPLFAEDFDPTEKQRILDDIRGRVQRDQFGRIEPSTPEQAQRLREVTRDNMLGELNTTLPPDFLTQRGIQFGPAKAHHRGELITQDVFGPDANVVGSMTIIPLTGEVKLSVWAKLPGQTPTVLEIPFPNYHAVLNGLDQMGFVEGMFDFVEVSDLQQEQLDDMMLIEADDMFDPDEL